jgi:hypothetical protein
MNLLGIRSGVHLAKEVLTKYGVNSDLLYAHSLGLRLFFQKNLLA